MPNFIVDKRLGAVPMDQLLDVRAQLRVDARIERPFPIGADRPVLDGDQALQPDTPYPAERSPALHYFLPRYRVAAGADGRPAVELRFDASDGGSIGSLTLTLAADAGDAERRVIDHRIALELRFRVPVQADGAAGAAAGAGIESRIALQPPVNAGPQGFRSVTRIADRGQFDAIYQALRSPEQQATLELRITARVGVRTWRQVLVGRPAKMDQLKVSARNSATFTQTLRAEPATAAAAIPKSGALRVRMADAAAADVQPTALQAAPARVAMQPRTMVAARPATMVAMQPRVAGSAAPAARQARSDAVFTAPPAAQARLAQLDAAALKSSVVASDLQIEGRRAVPIRIAFDDKQRPAVVDAELQCAQSLPFCFDPRQPQHTGVYVAEGYIAAIHMLLPLTLSKDGRVYQVVFQDNLMRDVVHVAPSEYRLQRELAAPYVPGLSFVASDFGTTDNGADADLLYRVSMVYALEPWLDPTVLELARETLAEQGLVARFTTSIPPDATLTLTADLLGAQQSRGAARVVGLRVGDVLDLDHATFVRLWREHLAQPTGITGRVDYKLFDGSAALARVRLSLWETSADLFDVAFLGPVAGQPGRLRARVRNRIESPVEIVELPGEVLPDKVIARPVDLTAAIGKVLQPNGSIDVDYDIGAAAAAPADFDPTVWGRSTPKIDALLRLLMVTQGYSSLSFDVTLEVADGVFAAAAGNPITGLLVEFDDGTRETLTPQKTRTEVSLFGRLIDQLMDSAGDNSKRFFYRVTNLHADGEGARTSWQDGQGGVALIVGKAQGGLDF